MNIERENGGETVIGVVVTGVFWFFLFYFLGLITHEGSHAIVGLLVGAKGPKVELYMGKFLSLPLIRGRVVFEEKPEERRKRAMISLAPLLLVVPAVIAVKLIGWPALPLLATATPSKSDIMNAVSKGGFVPKPLIGVINHWPELRASIVFLLFL